MTSSEGQQADDRAAAIRVLVVYHYVAHYREAVFRELVIAGRADGIQYLIAADTESHGSSIRLLDDDDLIRDLGVEWYRLRNVWFPAHFLWQRGLIGRVARERPDAVMFLGDFHMLSTWAAALIAKVSGARVFMWTHGYLRREPGLKGAVRHAFYSLADALLVYGRRAKALLEERGYPSDRVHVIYNSLDHRKQVKVREQLACESRSRVRLECLGVTDESVVVFAGRLEPFKSVELLLEAFAILRAARPKVKLVCIGDGPLRSALEDLSLRLGIASDVVFWGPCYDEGILGRLFHSADLCVSPGPVGLVAIHSLVYGTPVLIGDEPDQHGPEFEAISDGETGALFEAGSVTSLAQQMDTTLQRLSKPEVSEACVRVVDRHYTPANQVAIINSVVRCYCAT